MTISPTTREHGDLLSDLAKRRNFLRHTAGGLTDEQAAARTTVSELCIGGLIKHVTAVESRWIEFILSGPEQFSNFDEAFYVRHQESFRMLPGETLVGLLEAYEATARRTEEVVGRLPDLDVEQPLPAAPWFEPGARWSARQVLVHVIAETAQHAGHADILREAIDGQKTMG